MDGGKVFFLVILTILSLEYRILCQDIHKGTVYSAGPLDTSFDIHFGIHRERRAVTDETPVSTTEEPVVTATGESHDGDMGSTTETSTEASTTPGTTLPPTTTTNWTLVQDSHEYYSTQVLSGTSTGHQEFYKHKEDYPNTDRHDSLSDAHRTAFTLDLSFSFPFYGHNVKKITIATGGFLYMSDFVHQWLTATQYIAPLMANFDSRIGNDSHIYYVDTGSEFIVWWEHLHLNDDVEAGYFTFQARLSSSGAITFAYKEVPKNLPAINTKDHPVKVGLSDAFYIDEQISDNVKRRTIYEYHRVEVSLARIADNGAVLITPFQTCNMIDSCEACVTADINFDCHWCTSLSSMRCSDGLDRHRQEWLDSNCHEQDKINSGDCPVPESARSGPSSGTVAAVIIVVLLIVIIIVAATAWFVYAYRNPNTDSGRWLIEHRPSQIRESLNKVKFWKKDNTADKYGVSVGGETNA